MAFFDEVKKSITDVSETIAKKSSQLVEIQKLKMKKTSLEGDIKRDFALLGKFYFAKIDAEGAEGEKAEVIKSYERIISAREAIDEIQDKLSKITNEKSCCACGEKVPLDTIYCPRCGTRFEEEETIVPEASETVEAESETEENNDAEKNNDTEESES